MILGKKSGMTALGWQNITIKLHEQCQNGIQNQTNYHHICQNDIKY